NAEFHRGQEAVLRSSLRSLRALRLELLIVCDTIPLQECSKSRATVAVSRLFFRVQFGERLANLREIKQGVVSKTVLAPRRVENESFRRAAERVHRLAVAGHGEDADESPGALLFRDPFQFTQHARIVGFVFEIAPGGMGFVILLITV